MISQHNRQQGFGLFEVLITIIVLSIGLLGLAAMQATGLKNNQGAYRMSQGTLLAYDIADRMRSNMGGINSYLTSTMTLEAAKTAGVVSGCKTTSGCTTAQLAQSDLAQWYAALQADLPNSTGTIALAGTTYTVTVSWDDNLDGTLTSDDPSLQVSFQP